MDGKAGGVGWEDEGMNHVFPSISSHEFCPSGCTAGPKCIQTDDGLLGRMKQRRDVTGGGESVSLCGTNASVILTLRIPTSGHEGKAGDVAAFTDWYADGFGDLMCEDDVFEDN